MKQHTIFAIEKIQALDISERLVDEIHNNHPDAQSDITLGMLHAMLDAHIETLAEMFDDYTFDIEMDDIGGHHAMIESAYYILNNTDDVSYGRIDTLIDVAMNFIRTHIA